MQRNPEELYELGPAAPDIAGAPMLHYLEGFIDAGTAGRLLAEHLLRAFPRETVARFDTDRLIDYRSRRPLMTYDNSRWESYEPPELALHLLRHRMDVAHPPLECLVLENRRAAGEMIRSLDDRSGLLGRVDTGEAQRGALRKRGALAAQRGLPGVVKCLH